MEIKQMDQVDELENENSSYDNIEADESKESNISDQSKAELLKHIQATFTLMQRSLIQLSYFDVPCIDQEDNESDYRVYFSDQSGNFWFQLGFLEFIGLRPLSKNDEQLLLGEPQDLEKDIGKILRSNKSKQGNNNSLASFFYNQNLAPIPHLSIPGDFKALPTGDVFSLDRFLPNDRVFFQHDYDSLEQYLKEIPGPVYYAKGVIMKGRKQLDDAFDLWETGAFREKCLPCTCLCMRSFIEKNPEFHSVTADAVVDVAINSGIYYSTQIDRRQNHPSLVYNLAIMLDCSPGLRRAVVAKVKPVIEERLGRDNAELFSIEMAIWAKPSFMNALILYLLAEFNRTDPKYFLALTYLEYAVMIEPESRYGLILGDMLEFYFGSQADVTVKQVNYYIKAYRSSSEFVSATALARLTVIYQRGFVRAVTEQPGNAELHLSLYRDLKESNEYLEKICRIEAMKFMLDHHLQCLGYVTSEKQVVTSSKREIENLTLSRVVLLREAVKYIEFFRIMGERNTHLPVYFEVYRLLKYSEASLLALDNYRSNTDGALWEKSYCYALCKELGIGVDQDHMEAFKIYMNNFASLTARMDKEHFLEAGICLNRMADIISAKSGSSTSKDTKRPGFPANNQLEGNQKVPDEQGQENFLRTYALLFAVQSIENSKPTPKFVYLLSQILKDVKSLVLHRENKPEKSPQKAVFRRSVAIKGSKDSGEKTSLDQLINLQTKINKSTTSAVAIDTRPLHSREDSTRVQISQFLMNLWKNSIYLPCRSNEDFVYLYLIEHEISVHLDQYDTLRNIELRMATSDPERSDYLSRLKHMPGTWGHDGSNKEKIQAIKNTIESIKSLVTDGSIRVVDMSLVREKIVPILKGFEQRHYAESDVAKASQNAGQVLDVVKTFKLGVDKEKDALTYDILSKKFSTSRLEAAKRLEEELFSSSTKTSHQKIAEDISKVVTIQLLFETASKAIKQQDTIRFFHTAEIEVDTSKPPVLFSKVLTEEVYLYDAKIQSNHQLCKIFKIEFEALENLKNFLESLFWINTCAPYILNYYGIMLNPTPNSLVVNIVSEYFDSLVWSRAAVESQRSSPQPKVWIDPTIAIDVKFGLFEDLLLAVRSLHCIGVPHLTVTSGHMALLNHGRRLKLIVPFFLRHFYQHSESDFAAYLRTMEDERSEDSAYICPNLFKKYPTRSTIPLFDEKMPEKKFDLMKHDLWSLGVVLLEILSLRYFVQFSGGKKLLHPQDAVSSMIKLASKNHPGKDIRDFAIEKMMIQDPKYRLTSLQILNPISFGFSKHFKYSTMLKTKTERSYLLRSYFDSVRFEDSRETHLEAPLMTSRSNCRIFMSSNLELFGLIGQDCLPEGHCIVKQGRQPKLDSEFRSGLLGDQMTLINCHGELAKLRYSGDTCQSFELSHALFEHDTLDLSTQLVSDYLGPSQSTILDKFKSIDQKKDFSSLSEGLSNQVKKMFENIDFKGYYSEGGVDFDKKKKDRKNTQGDEDNGSGESMDDSKESEESKENEQVKDKIDKTPSQMADKKILVKALVQTRFSLSPRDSVEVKNQTKSKGDSNFEVHCMVDPFNYAYHVEVESFGSKVLYEKGRLISLRIQPNQLSTRVAWRGGDLLPHSFEEHFVDHRSF